MNRLASPLFVLLLGCTALSGSANAWSLFGDDSKSDAADQAGKDKAAATAPAGDLDSSIRQAQMLRLAGNYDEAVHHLSQLMMVASDDPRVISEYGKSLAAMGRAQESVQFLSHASQLQPTDWTIFSALGVAYDQLGKQDDAKTAYERALQLKPGEPSVLNNYALSRMLAHDPQMARKLAGRAQVANAESDPKIARNVNLINDLTSDPTLSAQDKAYAISKAAPSATPVPVPPATVPHPAPAAFVTAPARSSGAPHPLTATADSYGITPPSAPAPQGVVMQQVPNDPLAGPVGGTPGRREARAAGKPAAKVAAKSAPAKTAPEKTAKAKDEVPALRMSANAY